MHSWSLFPKVDKKTISQISECYHKMTNKHFFCLFSPDFSNFYPIKKTKCKPKQKQEQAMHPAIM